ncbi:MAG: sigma 54-interacting transcriptional regulator [Candidatus Brocadiae bacterium]|nr:sigma 54-interacting transcriptional regulator [Candidatus Brocadiia bacterium]
METRNLAAEARRVHDIVRDLNSELNLPRLLDRVLDTALSVSGAERGFIVLGTGGDATVRASRQLPGTSPAGEESFSRSVADQVLQTGTPFLSRDATLDDRLEGAASIRRLQVRSVLSMPFRLHGRLLGVFYLDHLTRADAFDPSAIDLLQTFADLAAVAIENARLFEENQQARQVLEREAQTLREELEVVKKGRDEGAGAVLKHPYAMIVGRGTATCRLLRQIDRACEMSLPVLIVGETGTGKELVARALHLYGAQGKGSIEVENCAAISSELMESELFGHVKGAFTGATSDHEGLFRRADGGTVFLDEIGELSLPLQAKLLRVIEDGVVRPVGSDKSQKVRVRVVAATNRDLEALSRTGAFRQDLYFRLASLVLRVPTLAERVEDIPALVKRFLARHNEMGIEPGALKLLMKTPWPGNIRQLQNFVEVVAAVSSGTVTEKDVRDLMDQKNPDAPSVPVGESLPASVDRYRREQALRALTDSGGDVTGAARALGISYQAMRKLVLKYDFAGLCARASELPGNRPARRGRWPRR